MALFMNLNYYTRVVGRMSKTTEVTGDQSEQAK